MELFILGGYGLFVWPAFIFTLLSCFCLYLMTLAELRKEEEKFALEFKKFHIDKFPIAKKTDNAKEVLSPSLI